ncbi:3-phosphoshikimate 1-carboxyvinyltransferase [Desulfovibrio oxyclinae]|uniref:3-phosphoshikimate 1-carboxyvinyltransferase n=1 Tax=Desulfovibrio oxyclinae TaxID=63560 RepID=UPI00036F6E54|nr:3-phosphoshikimate 1-carboxyvinyltransferase [Desulfovibrio oxyclinae]
MQNDTIIIQAPASKSLSHRTLIAGALAPGRSVISGLLDSDDIHRTRGCLEACGITFEDMDNGAVAVTGTEVGPKGGNHDGKDKDAAPAQMYFHESGTTARLMTAVAAAGRGRFRADGAPRMQERPMKELCDALTALGVDITYEVEQGFLPFVMDSAGYGKGPVDITLEESSQYLSGLLLGAPLSDSETIINVAGKKAVSWPYVALTLRIMEDFKADFSVQTLQGGQWTDTPWKAIRTVEPGALRFVVRPGGYRCTDYRVEGDWSNASYFLAAGAVGKKAVNIRGVTADSLQGDRAIIDILAQMGAGINVTPDKGVTIYPRKLRGITVDMGKCPDIVPTVAVAAAFAVSPTTITNVAHLRIKESDRLQACADQIAKTGCGVELFEDGIRIDPKPLPDSGTVGFETYGDHRIAMSMSIFGLAGIDVDLDNPACVGKSFPGFHDAWNIIMEGQD